MARTKYVKLEDVLECASDFGMFGEDDRNAFKSMVESDCKIITVDDNPKKGEGGE